LTVTNGTALCHDFGEVTEWPIVRHWKCRVGVKPHRGFESRPLRLGGCSSGMMNVPISPFLQRHRGFWPSHVAGALSLWHSGAFYPWCVSGRHRRLTPAPGPGRGVGDTPGIKWNERNHSADPAAGGRALPMAMGIRAVAGASEEPQAGGKVPNLAGRWWRCCVGAWVRGCQTGRHRPSGRTADTATRTGSVASDGRPTGKPGCSAWATAAYEELASASGLA
jgi:hypothetical protein